MRFGVRGLGFGVWGFRLGVWGLGFGVWVLRFRVLGLGFGVSGRGCRRAAPCWARSLAECLVPFQVSRGRFEGPEGPLQES